MDQTNNSSSTVWYIVGALVIVALAFWYFTSPKSPSAPAESTAVQAPANTTATISGEFSQTQDNPTALEQDAAASAAAVQSF